MAWPPSGCSRMTKPGERGSGACGFRSQKCNTSSGLTVSPSPGLVQVLSSFSQASNAKAFTAWFGDVHGSYKLIQA